MCKCDYGVFLSDGILKGTTARPQNACFLVKEKTV